MYGITLSGSPSKYTSTVLGPFLKQSTGGLLTVSKLVSTNVHGSFAYLEFCKLSSNNPIAIASFALLSDDAKEGTG